MWDLATDKLNGPTFERVRELFDYQPETGKLIRRVTTNNRSKAGAVAGCKSKSDGYLVVNIDHHIHKRLFAVHRVIWLWMTGSWPKSQIDHINGIRDDNRWVNLREANNIQNNRNVGVKKSSKTGVSGVTWQASRKKFRVRIKIDGTDYTIGRYDTLEEAKMWRKLAEEEFYGEYAPKLRTK